MLSKIAVIFFFFFFTTGMRLFFFDGNFADVDEVFFDSRKVVFKKNGNVYKLDERFVNKELTQKLYGFEKKKISVFKSYSSYLDTLKDREVDMFHIRSVPLKKNGSNNETKVKIEIRKETNPFFVDEMNKEEDFLEKIRRKGIFFKIQIPVKEEDK